MIALAAMLAASAALQAAEPNGLTLVGSETRSMLFTDCYRLKIFDQDGRLGADDLSDSSQSKRIEVEVLYDGELPDMPEGWTEEIMPLIGDEKEAALRRAYSKLAEGDVIALDYTPSTGSVLRRNGEVVFTDPGYSLTAGMLDVWFGKTPVDEDIKAAFLGD